MPIASTLNRHEGYLTERAHGVVTFSEFVEASQAWGLADPATAPKSILSDYRDAQLDLDSREVACLALWLRETLKPWPHGHWAILVRDPATFGQFRMLQSLLSQQFSNMCITRGSITTPAAFRRLPKSFRNRTA